MTVPSAAIETLVGVMPSGWLSPTLSELVSFAPKVPSSVLEEDCELSFIPMPCVAEVSGRIDLTQTIGARAAKSRSLTYFEDGDVIFAKITPCMENGKIACPVGLQNGAAFGSTEFHVMRPSERVSGEFLRYFLVSDDFRNEAARFMTGAVGQRRVPRKFLETYPIPIPPLSEQQRIVEILEEQSSRLDAALESVRIVREKAAQFRRSLLHAAFMGELSDDDPNEWITRTLGEVATFLNGRAYKKQELLTSGPYRVLRVGNFFSNNSWYWSDLELDASKYCEAGDLLYAWSASFGPRIWQGEKVIFHYHIWKVVEDSGQIDKQWLKYWLDNDVERIKSAVGTGTTMMHVTKREMEKRAIRIPPILVQREIVNALNEQLTRLDAALGVAEAIERRARALRRSLLHAAFTGKLTEQWREEHAHV
jgi:type I restriction enzyme S subunit